MITSPSSTSATQAPLELFDNGACLVRLTFGIELFTTTSFYECGPQLLRTWSQFQKLCPPERLTYYCTESMKTHKPMSQRTLSMIETWLAPDVARKSYLALEMKASERPTDAPIAKYEIWSDEDVAQARLISIALPSVWSESQAEHLLQFVRELCDNFPLRCGLAGYAFECSRYDRRRSEAHAWNLGMRYRGINIVRIPFDAAAAGNDGMQGIGWLTVVGWPVVKDLGGTAAVRAALSTEVEIVESRNGIILRLGATPSLCDANRQDSLPLYRSVYRLFAPWIERAAGRAMAMRIGPDAIERTEAWYKRLAK